MSVAATACLSAQLVIGVAAAALLESGAGEPGPHDWLERMADAVRTTDYEGTVIRMQNGEAEALKVAHQVKDGVVLEKVIVQEGSGLEIIRNGNEVHCILPERKSVLVEDWSDESTLFSMLPSSDFRFGSEYDVSIVRRDRVAGRKAVVLAIRPHDSYRYGHRLWLDVDTAFPLQTQLIGVDGSPLLQLKFADIELDPDIVASELEPSYRIDTFTWYTEPGRGDRSPVETDWQSDALPAGFRVISTQREQLPASEATVTHILYSDGLANVSVFIAEARGEKPAERWRVGASNAYSTNSYSTMVDGYHVTAVGEVPEATVRQVATSMRRRQ